MPFIDYLQSSWDLYPSQPVASLRRSNHKALTRFRASIEKAAGSRAASYLDAKTPDPISMALAFTMLGAGGRLYPAKPVRRTGRLK